MLRISSVSYINAQPFVYGIRHSGALKEYELASGSPYECAAKLISGEADVGIVPVSALAGLGSYEIITDYCIGCTGAVRTVKLFSEVPLHEIRSVYLDYQSRTSVALLKLLAGEYWNITPAWLDGWAGYENNISGDTAGLVIGDRVFGMEGNFRHEYDLGEHWALFTGLPFVFACWVAVRALAAEEITTFGRAVDFGVRNRRDAVKPFLHKVRDCENYVMNDISYGLDEAKKKAMQKFLLMTSHGQGVGQRQPSRLGL